MIAQENGGPAFPNQGLKPDSTCASMNGMSLRDWFAGQAPPVPEWFSRMFMYGADPDGTGTISEKKQATLGQQKAAYFAWRWAYADDMLAARNKEPSDAAR